MPSYSPRPSRCLSPETIQRALYDPIVVRVLFDDHL
jgi:hypothetical protein